MMGEVCANASRQKVTSRPGEERLVGEARVGEEEKSRRAPWFWWLFGFGSRFELGLNLLRP